MSTFIGEKVPGISLFLMGMGVVINAPVSKENEMALILSLTISPVPETVSQNEVVCFCLATNLCVRP